MKPGSVVISPQKNPSTTISRHTNRNFLSSILGVTALLLAAASARAQSTFAPDPVGTPVTQTVTVTPTTTGTATVEVLTAGASGKDFAVGTGGSTCSGSVISGTPCTESVTFTPSAPGTRIGAVVLLSSTPSVLGVAYLVGTGTGSLGVVVPGNESIVAGDGDYLGSVNDGGLATAAELYLPSSVVFDGAGNMYIADSAHNRIRMVCGKAATPTISGTTCPIPSGATTGAGVITTIAGNGTAGSTGNSGPASSALLDNPSGLAIDGAGNLYIADTGNNEVREIVAATGNIVLVAGNGTAGYSGDGAAATSAMLNGPLGVTLDTSGNLYIADTDNARIREVPVPISTSNINTVAGDGTAGYNGDNQLATNAELNSPYAVAFDASGNMYIPDSENNRVRMVCAGASSQTIQGLGITCTASTIWTIAGNGTAGYAGDNDAANNAAVELWAPSGVTLDAAGNLYIADTQNNAIRKVNVSSGDISTLVKNGVGTYYQNSAFSSIALYGPIGITLDGSGDLYIADSLDMVVRQIQGNLTAIDYKTTIPENSQSSAVSVTIENDGNAALDLTAITPSTNALVSTATTTCALGTPGLALATDCIVGAVFAPTASGPLTANIDVTSAAINSPVDIELIGTASASTTTSLTSNVNPSNVGQSVTFTATVAIADGGGAPSSGTVTFMDGATDLSGPVTLSGGVATYTTSTLAIGTHAMTAVYSGDTADDVAGSTSAVYTQDVQAVTTITLTSSLNPSNYGATVTFAASVSSNSTIPATGTVNFLDGATTIGTGTLSGNPAVATYSTKTLSIGTHSITATYAGDTNNGAATSTALSQVVNQAQTATTVTAVPNPGIAGKPIAITATVNVTAGSTTPTGTVTFTSGTTALGSTALTNGTAVINPVLAPGTYQIVATYTGDTDDAGSASTALPLTVNLATTTTTFTVAPNPAVVDSTVTFTATVTGNGGTPTGTVSFLNGTTLLGTATLNAQATATFSTSTLAVGTYTVTASYSGDTNDSPSTSGATSLTVSLIPTTTNLSAATTAGSNPQTVLIAVVLGTSGPTPTGSVTFTSGTTTIGSGALNTNGVVTLTPNLAAGNYSIVANYSGDSIHSPSASTPVTVDATPVDFNLTVTPATVSVKTSQNATVTVNLTSEGGFTDTIGLGCASLPPDVTCLFSNNTVNLSANGTASVQLSIDTNIPIGGGTSAMNRRGTGTGELSMAGLFLPFSAFFGWFLWRLRKRSMGLLTLGLVIALSAGALLASGCGGYSSSSAAPGTYVIQVTGTGTSSNVIHYQNVSLTVTN